MTSFPTAITKETKINLWKTDVKKGSEDLSILISEFKKAMRDDCRYDICIQLSEYQCGNGMEKEDEK